MNNPDKTSKWEEIKNVLMMGVRTNDWRELILIL